ncbi:MAG: HAMP domain-containing protein [Sphaerospermopsis sp. SIO1G1]|nr:HAMP domain-containing protein [Sphaerospermopsis sp. SIO1G1]
MEILRKITVQPYIQQLSTLWQNLRPKIHFNVSLRLLLIGLFMIQIFLAVGSVGYLSFVNGQKAVNDLVTQLMNKTSSVVDQHLNSYLAVPTQLNQMNADAVKTGILDLQNLEVSGKYLWKQMQLYKNLGYNGYLLTTGKGAGAGNYPDRKLKTLEIFSDVTEGVSKIKSYSMDEDGNIKTLMNTYDYQGLAQPWYVKTVKAGYPIWSGVHPWVGAFNSGSIAASANYPIYNNQGKLTAVFGIDLLLSNISKFLDNIDFSDNGVIFIMDRNGLLVANSGDTNPYKFASGEVERLAAIHSSNPLIKSTSKYLLNSLDNLQTIQEPQQIKFNFRGNDQFVKVTPWKDKLGLDWLVVIAVPESDFMAQIDANTRNTIFLSIVILILVFIVSTCTSNCITQPIFELSKVSELIANGQLNKSVDVRGTYELKILSDTFNKMVQQLQESFTALETANQNLEIANTELEARVEKRTVELKATIEELHQTQAQIVQSEKMSALGEMIAGIAHEINNPVNFIYGNIYHLKDYSDDLLTLIQLYQSYLTEPPEEIAEKLVEIDFEFLQQDLCKVLISMEIGTQRIQEIVLSLRNFSRLDEAEVKAVDINEGINSTLVILSHRLKAKCARTEIEIIKNYGNLPLIDCYASQINQVFMNIINNAIDALEEQDKLRSLEEIKAKPSTIKISTVYDHEWISIHIADNGMGIQQKDSSRVFNPFFTTKGVGEGTGLGLSISYQIITQKHCGQLFFNSVPGEGTEFVIKLPLNGSRFKL